MLPAPVVPMLPRLVGAHLLDAATAALVWLLLERGVPVIVAGPEAVVVDTLLDAFAAALPRDRRPDPAPGTGGDRLVRVAGRVEVDTPPGILRAALGVTTGRSGLALAIVADDLEGILTVLRGQGLTDDEVTFMGVVLVLGARGPQPDDGAPDGGRQPDGHEAARLVAAHYLRPVVLDAGGHPRRLPPAVLATWDPATDAWDDYAWGLTADLAERARMRVGDLEAERERRAAALTEHAGRGPVG